MREILLTEDELKQLLRGTLVWSDIAYKLNTPTGARSPVRGPGHYSSHDQAVKSGPWSAARPVGHEAELDSGEDRLGGHEESSYVPLSGKKVVFLLSGTGIAVVSLWLYFFIR